MCALYLLRSEAPEFAAAVTHHIVQWVFADSVRTGVSADCAKAILFVDRCVRDSVAKVLRLIAHVSTSRAGSPLVS